MNLDLKKSIFTPHEVGFILNKLRCAYRQGYLAATKEKNPYLMAGYKGVEEKGITPKWNIKIYDYNGKKRGHSLVCVDLYILDKLIQEDFASFIPPNLKLLRIDDAGWGFPLCGVMVGVCDEKEVKTATVPVEYFRDDTPTRFETKKYLDRYAQLAVELVEEFEASPESHRIEICTGYVNQPLKERLRRGGFDVRVVEIKGMLQDELEALYKQHIVQEVGADIYYDPKDMKKSEIPKKYRESLHYGREYCPEKIKTGWRSIRDGG